MQGLVFRICEKRLREPPVRPPLDSAPDCDFLWPGYATGQSLFESGANRQMSGRTLAMGDIHGCVTALELLQSIDLQPEDSLVTLGDYIDRGPDTLRVIDSLTALRQTHYLVPLRGNHEFFRTWQRLPGHSPFRAAALYLALGTVYRSEAPPVRQNNDLWTYKPEERSACQ